MRTELCAQACVHIGMQLNPLNALVHISDKCDVYFQLFYLELLCSCNSRENCASVFNNVVWIIHLWLGLFFFINLKLGQATSRNQASCSMRLLRKHLLCTLPSLFLLRPTFYFVVVFSLFTAVYSTDSRQDETLQGKLQRCKLGLFQLDLSQLTVSPAAQLVKFHTEGRGTNDSANRFGQGIGEGKATRKWK